MNKKRTTPSTKKRRDEVTTSEPRLRIYDVTVDAVNRQSDNASNDSSAALALVASHYYFVFPAYVPDFIDMRQWRSHWHRALADKHRFWPGFAGGGILAVPLDIPVRRRITIALNMCYHHKPVYGLACGNESGQQLNRCVSCVIPLCPSAPDFAVKKGFVRRIPNPTIKVTVEHANCVNDERFLVVVPKPHRKSVKLQEMLPEWFCAFGVEITPPATRPPDSLQEEMQDWFADPKRAMFALPTKGGEPNAGWQLAVMYYVAEHWDLKATGLDSMHVVADIEGKPNFRKYWTSNR